MRVCRQCKKCGINMAEIKADLLPVILHIVMHSIICAIVFIILSNMNTSVIKDLLSFYIIYYVIDFVVVTKEYMDGTLVKHICPECNKTVQKASLLNIILCSLKAKF